jgi:hypothetical protein
MPMVFKLNYDDLVPLDAESLAEMGIKSAYEALLPTLARYVEHPAPIQEIIDRDAPHYAVTYRDREYLIYSPDSDGGEGRGWGNATYTLFYIINDQLANTQADLRFYAINGGNQLGGIFLARAQCEAARLSLPRKSDWPYLPKLEYPWYGQHH